MKQKTSRPLLDIVRDCLNENSPAANDVKAGEAAAGAAALLEGGQRYRNIETTLRFIAQLGWTGKSDSFLTALARYLGESLDVDYVIIDRLTHEPHVAETAALYAKGAIVPNIQYRLKGTPCDNVMGKRICYYPRGVQELFPEDTLLGEMGVESYAGIPLWDQAGGALGLIALMDHNPLEDEEAVSQILQLVAVSAAAALERERSDALLRQREEEFRILAERYRLVFENSPVSLWEEDFSEINAFFHRLREDGVTDIERYFDGQPEAVRRCADLVKVIDVNRATLALHGAKSKEELLSGLAKTFDEESLAAFRKELVCLWKGEQEMNCETTVRTLCGLVRHVTVYFAVCPGYEEDLSKVLVSLVDITARKDAENALMGLNMELELRVRKRTSEMEEKNAELARLNKLFVGRELRMVQLKEKIRELENLNPKTPAQC